MEFSLCPDLGAGLDGAFRGTLTSMSQLEHNGFNTGDDSSSRCCLSCRRDVSSQTCNLNSKYVFQGKNL